jgi:anti-sigma regulatory factor (Ser/Thr protein kinase)
MAPVKAGESEVIVALQQALLAEVIRLDPGQRRDLTARGFPGRGTRMFGGSADQVACVRAFARAWLLRHQACDDAVLVASELAANAVAHSASGWPGGVFLVALAVLGDADVRVIVTDLGGPGLPQDSPDAAADAESGRGLAVVRALAPVTEIFDGTGRADGLRSVLAVVGPAGDCGGGL